MTSRPTCERSELRVRPGFARAVVLAIGVASFAGCRARPEERSGGTTARVEATAPAASALEGAPSTFLRDHASDAVRWEKWSPAVLERARRENKLLFVSVGFASCHFCHEMQREVFRQDAVGRALDDVAVSVLIDREERPDLDEWLLDAARQVGVEAGYPLNLFFTPSLVPLGGVGYVKADAFLAALRSARAIKVAPAKASTEVAAAGDPLDEASLRSIAMASLARVDAVAGGFAGAPKAPSIPAWTFLLHAWRRWGDADLGHAIDQTGDALATGALRDPIGGGFHRYCRDRYWRIPHYEKTLVDNALVAQWLFEAGDVSKRAAFTDAAAEAMDFVLRELRTEHGTFAASLDAGGAGEEGAFYRWSEAEVRAATGADAEVAIALLDVPHAGSGALNRRTEIAQVATLLGRPRDSVTRAWERSKAQLFALRATRPHPRRDTKVVTSWNGLVLSSLVHAFRATRRQAYRDAAVLLAEQLWSRQHGANGLVRSTTDEVLGDAAVIEDYAAFARGLLDLYAIDKRPVLRDHAAELVTKADEHFSAPSGGWYRGVAHGDVPRVLAMSDDNEPSGSALLLEAMQRLVALGETRFEARVTRVLAGEAGEVRRRGLGAAGWLDASLSASTTARL